MADFREELHVERCKKEDGSPSFFPWYSWCLTKTDLADDTVEIVGFNPEASIAEVCEQIANFESPEWRIKLGIKEFLEKDSYYSSDEY